jgi:nucleoid-associated protein YgaU
LTGSGGEFVAKVLINVMKKNGNWTKVSEIPVLFYPSQYTQQKTVNYPEADTEGDHRIQFAGSKPETLSMNLFFDTYVTGEDVRIYTKKITDLMEGNPPPVLMVVWGKINFLCVLESVTKTFTMFRADGAPVRATLDVNFKEYVDPSNTTSNTTSQDTTKVQTVKSGDSLSSMASDVYGDPAKWRDIAETNNISNPRVLSSGQDVTIPPA